MAMTKIGDINNSLPVSSLQKSDLQQQAPVSSDQFHTADKVSLSATTLTDALANELLIPSGLSNYENEIEVHQIDEQFVKQSQQQIHLGIKTPNQVLVDSQQAHDNVKTLFSNLNSLNSNIDSELNKSESSIANKIKLQFGLVTNEPNTSPKPQNTQASNGINYTHAPKFSAEIKTQDGDKVTIQYDYLSGVNLEVNGKISHQEQEALSAVYQSMQQFIDQTWLSNSDNFNLTSLSLNENFDSNLLSGFSIEAEKGAVKSNVSYEIDKVRNQQNFSTSMELAGSSLNYDLDITTALTNSGGNQSDVLKTLTQALNNMDVGTSVSRNASQFITTTFSQLLNVPDTETISPKKVNVQLVNQAIAGIDNKIGNIGVKQFSELPDYQFSLDISQMNFGQPTEMHGRIDLSQQTTSKHTPLGHKFGQQTSVDIDMEKISMNGPNNSETITNWSMSATSKIDVLLDNEMNLKAHNSSETFREKWTHVEENEDGDKVISHTATTKSEVNKLAVLTDTIRVTQQQSEKQNNEQYLREEDKAPQKVYENRYIREYQQILNFKPKSY